MGILRRLTPAALVTVVLACDHLAPFVDGNYANTTPFQPGPARLTYDSGVDTRASWLPTGTGFLYTQQQWGSPDQDRCLALMPASGGTVTRTICSQSDLSHDSLNDFESPAVSLSAKIVYVETSMINGIGHAGPDHAALVIAPYGNPLATTVLTPLSYFGPASRPVDMVSDVHWVGPSTIVFLTEQWTYPSRCGSCSFVDTVRNPLDIQRIDIGGTSVLTLVPNTDGATSVTAGGPDTIFYTLAGDVNVHRRVLSTDADVPVHPFSVPPLDVTIAGTRLGVVINDHVEIVDLVDTAYHQTLTLPQAHLHRPALSPDGHTLVVEGFALDTLGQETDPPDLWMWRFP